jgi:glycosyltransferase involved in cell wall biosynthesis
MSSRQSISLLIPNRDAGLYAAECAGSVAPFLSEFEELVVVDGESSDGSREALFDLARKHPHAKCLVRPPTGVYPAWNLGVAECTSDWLVILPSDDLLHPAFLNAVRPYIHHGLPITVGLQVIGVGTLPDFPVDVLLSENCRPETAWRRNGTCERAVMTLLDCTLISFTQHLLPRQSFERAGPFDEKVGNFADNVWYSRMLRCYDIIYVHKTASYWRVRPGQNTTTGINNYNRWKQMHAPYVELPKHLRGRAQALDACKAASISLKSRSFTGFSADCHALLRHPFLSTWSGLRWLAGAPSPEQRLALAREYLRGVGIHNWLAPLTGR